MTFAAAFLAFLLSHAACVAGAATGWSAAGPLAVGVLLALRSFQLPDPARQLGYVAAVGVAGTALESAAIWAGVYVPADALPESRLCPLWITACWVNLGLLLIAAPERWRANLWPWALAGLAAAPVAYLAADELASGAIHLRRPLWQPLVLLTVVGQAMLPALVRVSRARWYQPRQVHN